jgi:hypothetical protein
LVRGNKSYFPVVDVSMKTLSMAVSEIRSYLVRNQLHPHECKTSIKLAPSITVYQIIYIYITTYEDIISVVIVSEKIRFNPLRKSVKSPLGDL